MLSKGERELALIEKNLVFVDDHWEVKYPWIKDPHQVPTNVARKKLIQTEKRLMRDASWMQTYIDQMTDMIDRRVGRKLTQEEIVNYAGPIHYISHHAVIKKDSTTTPVLVLYLYCTCLQL